MKTASVRTLRNDYAELLRRVERGEEITIARRGRPVARLVPLESTPTDVNWKLSSAARIDRSAPPLDDTARREILESGQGRW